MAKKRRVVPILARVGCGRLAVPGALTLTTAGRNTAVAFVWAASAGADSYVLQIGRATGVYDVYDANVGNVLTKTVRMVAGVFYARVVPYTGESAGTASDEQTVAV